MKTFINVIYYILTIIAVGNISVAVFLTTLRIEKSERSKKGIASALYFAFTLLGLYALQHLLERS